MKKILILFGLFLTLSIAYALDKDNRSYYYFESSTTQENNGCKTVLPPNTKYCENIEYVNFSSIKLSFTTVESNKITLLIKQSKTEPTEYTENYVKGMCKQISLNSNNSFIFNFKENNLCQCLIED